MDKKNLIWKVIGAAVVLGGIYFFLPKKGPVTQTDFSLLGLNPGIHTVGDATAILSEQGMSVDCQTTSMMDGMLKLSSCPVQGVTYLGITPIVASFTPQQDEDGSYEGDDAGLASVRIRLPYEKYDETLRDLKAKYGKPRHEFKGVSDGGMIFRAEAVWENQDGYKISVIYSRLNERVLPDSNDAEQEDEYFEIILSPQFAERE